MAGYAKYGSGKPIERKLDRKRKLSQRGDDRYDHASVEDMEYTDAELEFFRAVEKFKADKHEPFPTLRDLLRILTELGYTKCPVSSSPAIQAQPGPTTPSGSITSSSRP